MRFPDQGPWLPWGDDQPPQAGLQVAQLAGLVLDDVAATRSGLWTHSTWSNHYVGDGYVVVDCLQLLPM